MFQATKIFTFLATAKVKTKQKLLWLGKLLWLWAIRAFLTLFWACFFVVPGVLFFLNSCLAPSICLQSQQMDVRGALLLSKELICGQRLKIFVCLCWGLLSALLSFSFAIFVLAGINCFLNIPIGIFVFVAALVTLLDVFCIAKPMLKKRISVAFELAKNQKFARAEA